VGYSRRQYGSLGLGHRKRVENQIGNLYIDPNAEVVIVRVAIQPAGMEEWPYQTARLVMQTVAESVSLQRQ